MASTHDVLIIGHGIAGAVLAEEALRRGLRVHVFDRERPGRASAAAAGVVNPLVLRRDVPAWRAEELVPLASSFYARMQERLGIRVWHPLDLVKVFPTPKEEEQWQRALEDPARARFMAPASRAMVHPLIRSPQGHGTVSACARLDVPELLAAQRKDLLAREAFTEMDVPPGPPLAGPDGVSIGECSAPWAVWCQGPFGAVPGLVPVKGETLLVRIPGFHLDRMVHRGIFLLPVGGDRYRVGATFAWGDVWSGPSASGREELLRRLRLLTEADVQVLEHTAGVRPAAKDRRPLLGPIGPHRAVLNGLGSRGVSLAPWCAGHLFDHLFEGVPLDAEVAVQRFS